MEELGSFPHGGTGLVLAPIPVLTVYALINRLYILDLIPGRSFVRHLLGKGLDVYAVDWGTPRGSTMRRPLF